MQKYFNPPANIDKVVVIVTTVHCVDVVPNISAGLNIS